LETDLKTIIAILIFLGLVQASVWPLHFGLILILTRSFIRQDSSNLILAFGFGIFYSFLNQLPLGLTSLVFITLVELIYLWSKTTFSHNLWTIIPVVGMLLAVADLTAGIPFSLPKILIEMALTLPLYLAVRFWEERFIVKRDTRLKI
jgi:hypothetical protein